MARVALCQFPVTEDKDVNHKTASSYLKRAAEGGAQLAVLPEIWNSPYATAAFEEYAQVLPQVGDTNSEKSPSAQLLMDHAKTNGMFIVGGSIPEIDGGKIFNTCLVINPSGQVVAKHRKVHLFDIDVPGGITFRESDTLSPGETITAFDGGDVFGMVGVGIWYVGLCENCTCC
jgi:omega-amidase